MYRQMSPQLSNLIFIAIMIAVFYLLMIRPQQQRQRRQGEMLAALKPGDEVVTIGGIYGRVVAVDERVRITVAEGAELEVAKAAIASVVEGEAPVVDLVDAGPETDSDSDTE